VADGLGVSPWTGRDNERNQCANKKRRARRVMWGGGKSPATGAKAEPSVRVPLRMTT